MASAQDLLLKTCAGSCTDLWRGIEQDSAGFYYKGRARSCKDLLQDASRIFTRSSHKDRSCKDLWQDSIRIFTADSHKDLNKTLVIFHWDLQECWERTTILIEGTKGGTTILCASLRSRNAQGHLTRAISCKKLRQKCHKTDGVPWSNPGLNS